MNEIVDSNTQNLHIDSTDVIIAINEDLSVNCFHSIFGDNSDSNEEPQVSTDNLEFRNDGEKWTEPNINSRITIADLKNDNLDFLSPGFRIEYIKDHVNDNSLTNSILNFKAEPFFDKISARERFKCPNCYFLTDNRGNLKQHMKVHLRPEGSAIFQCDFCDFRTKYKNSIKGHVSRHRRSRGKKGRKKKK